MPYKSRAQAAYMHIHHPEIAKRWDAEYGSAGPLPKRLGQTKGAKSSVRRRMPKQPPRGPK